MQFNEPATASAVPNHTLPRRRNRARKKGRRTSHGGGRDGLDWWGARRWKVGSLPAVGVFSPAVDGVLVLPGSFFLLPRSVEKSVAREVGKGKEV
jgi:hypothetical protein